MASDINNAVSEVGKNLESSLSDQRAAQQQLLDGLQSSFNETMSNISMNLNELLSNLMKQCSRRLRVL